MAFVKRRSKKKIAVTGDLILENLETVHREFLDKEPTGGETVDLSGVERFDLPGLQWLYALNGDDRSFEYGENGPRFAKMAKFAGFRPLPGSDTEDDE